MKVTVTGKIFDADKWGEEIEKTLEAKYGHNPIARLYSDAIAMEDKLIIFDDINEILKELGAEPDELIRVGKSTDGILIDAIRVMLKNYRENILEDYYAKKEKG